MSKFFVYENKDASLAYVRALKKAGYQHVNDIGQADFILYDSPGVGWRFDSKVDFMRKGGVSFIYPHTPFTCYLWDGPYPVLPVACNFVAGPGAKECIQRYGYPYRIEAVGFTRCQVKGFTRTKGERLLFVPARPRRDHGRQEKLDRFALDWIMRNRNAFREITICRIVGQFPELEEGQIGNVIVLTTHPKQVKNPAKDMVARIDAADLVISVTTPAALAVARGRPTVMYGQDKTPETLTGRRAKNFEAYKDVYAYPLSLEKMSLSWVKAICKNQNSEAELWKRNFIGGPFDVEKFLKIIRECTDENLSKSKI